MRYSAFEQAAAEASLGMREIDTQIEQIKSQMEQLRGKRDLLDTLSRQLLSLRPGNGDASPSNGSREKAAEAPEAASSSNGAPDIEAEMATAGVYNPPRSLRDGWFSRSSDSGVRGPSGDSGIRSRL